MKTHSGEPQPHGRVLTPRSRREVERRHTPSHVELELVHDDETELPERSLAGRMGDVFKRLFDFSAALIGLVVLLPVFFVVAVAIHAPIGLRNVMREWTRWRGPMLDIALALFALLLLGLGARAVFAVFTA